MVGSRNEPEQVLELLKAAAGELKTTQSELEAERSKNKQLVAQIERLESQLRATPQAMTDVRAGLVITVPSNVRAAVEEDVHVVGLSILSGAHNALVPEILDGLKKEGLDDALILVGGIIPDEDFEPLKKAGVHLIFTPGTSLQEVVDSIKANAPKRT